MKVVVYDLLVHGTRVVSKLSVVAACEPAGGVAS